VKDSLSNHTCNHEAEFGAFHESLADIKQAISGLCKLIEGQGRLEERVKANEKAITELRDVTSKLVTTQARCSGSNQWVEKTIWVILSLGLGALFGGKML